MAKPKVKTPAITDLIGNTPLVRLEHAHFRKVEIWAKLEDRKSVV